MRHTFYRMFCESCTVFADGTALVDGEERITYAQLFEGVESEAARLRHIGVRRGDHVALLFPNSARFVVELFALMRLRAVPVPLNWRLTAGAAGSRLLLGADRLRRLRSPGPRCPRRAVVAGGPPS